ncbi:MAG: sugar ABC transporter substrate-binding protein [Devosia sp.]
MLKHTLRNVLIATAMAGAVSVAALSGAMADDKIKIGFILKFPGGFFDILKGGGQTFASAHPDVEMLFAEAKSGTDIEGQIALIESMITQGVQGIAITPVDPAVAPALDEAVKAGIKVVLMDNDIPTWDGKTALVATDNFAGGQLAGEYLKAHIPAGATVGQIAGVPGVPSLDDRLKGMAAGLGDGYNIVGGNVSTGCGAEKAVGAAEDILTANPDVAAFYGACQGPTEGAISALANAGIDPASVIVVGFDGADSELVAIEGGTEAATVMQFPAKIGEIGAETTYKAIKGEEVAKFVDTGTALITKANLAQYKK